MTETNRDKLLAKIKALFSKTVAAGATEAEELAAAEKARELIELYQIDLGAEELKREGFIRKTIKLDRTQFTFARRLMLAMDEFCEVSSWYMSWRGLPPEITVIGLASDAEFAIYLIENLTTFAVAGADMHIAVARKMAIVLGSPMNAASSREEQRSYLLGCANRISMRLKEMTQQRRSQAAKPGSDGALIKLDKPDLIRAEMERLNIRVHTGSSLTRARNSGAFDAGAAHGAKASFGRPVGGGRIAGLIGRSKS